MRYKSWEEMPELIRNRKEFEHSSVRAWNNISNEYIVTCKGAEVLRLKGKEAVFNNLAVPEKDSKFYARKQLQKIIQKLIEEQKWILI